MSSAAERVREALLVEGHERGRVGTVELQGPRGLVKIKGPHYVEVDAADIVALAQRAKGTPAGEGSEDQRSRIVRDLHMGSHPHRHYEDGARRRVWIKADDAFHLLDQQPAEVKEEPKHEQPVDVKHEPAEVK